MVIVIHPGTVPICEASQPTVPDFSCGFQPHLSSGTRSSTLRVFCISWSNSASIDCPIVMSASNEKSLLGAANHRRNKSEMSSYIFRRDKRQHASLSDPRQ